MDPLVTRLALAGVDADQPLARRVTRALRQAILTGQLKPGTRLPSTRALAVDLSVSRNTVLDAYAQLLSEGYVEARHGSGTFVSHSLADDVMSSSIATRRRSAKEAAAPLSQRGVGTAALRTSVTDDVGRAFCPGIPALESGLFRTWMRIAARRQRQWSSELANYGDAAGYRRLREAIAAYLGPARGVVCTADQVIVSAGTQQALDMAARLLLDPGDAFWFEEPGYLAARAALAASGATPIPVPVDADGLRVDVGRRRAPKARLAYVTPSHQYPLGVTMTLARRLRLLEWARQAGAAVVEDDYDSEFRYEGRPLPALQSLDRAGHVVYVATFSKVLFPALRLGYLIVPSPLVPAFRNLATIAGLGAPRLAQAALADFIEEGHFARHIRRMRAIYAERRELFGTLIEERLGRRLQLHGTAAGLHVSATLTSPADDRAISRRASALGLTLPALSDYYSARVSIPGFVLGYGHLNRQQIVAGIDAMGTALGVRERSLKSSR
jgi:GntR family transcriptional regulator / MocR family aminotransferase